MVELADACDSGFLWCFMILLFGRLTLTATGLFAYRLDSFPNFPTMWFFFTAKSSQSDFKLFYLSMLLFQ